MNTVISFIKLLVATIFQLILLKPKWDKENKSLVFTTGFKPMGYSGYTIAMLVWIYEKSSGSKGLYAHEMSHVEDFYEEFPKSLVSWLSKKSRLKGEVKAYKIQMKYGLPIQKAAEFLSTRYPFGLSYKQALNLLKA